ncbi:DUF4559 domain-containing protein [Vibrio genomosp. F6]|uniref:DUF4145 domain-containing protein n=1 Tax=Vibrio genomosp. F6 str. FF-238 TaxID=1191298 RepID=A0A1E5D4K0_9VIBR|nr:DUF4559 domain-containing protein [Vibrio genomosp. F6]OEE78502.1 hypothetical protein A130_13105 [Vibrio genomosp. F6 str. FF-238]
MNYVVEIIKAVAWPLSIVWLGYLFRTEVRGLFGRVSTLKYKDMEASFEKQLTKVENEAKGINEAKTKPLIADLPKAEQLLRIAEVSPRAAIVEAWTMIEVAAAERAVKSGVQFPRTNPKMIVNYLAHCDEFSDSNIEVIEQLRKLRNRAVHMPDFVITQDEAERYMNLAVRSAAVISEDVS